MRTYFMALGFDIYKSVMIACKTPTNPPTDVVGKNPSEKNSKAMNFSLCGLSKSEFVKVMHCKSTKKFGTSLKISMKEITRLRRKRCKLIEDSSRV
jgi:hypothetical protein